jgi:hypothetical protein
MFSCATRDDMTRAHTIRDLSFYNVYSLWHESNKKRSLNRSVYDVYCEAFQLSDISKCASKKCLKGSQIPYHAIFLMS